MPRNNQRTFLISRFSHNLNIYNGLANIVIGKRDFKLNLASQEELKCVIWTTSRFVSLDATDISNQNYSWLQGAKPDAEFYNTP